MGWITKPPCTQCLHWNIENNNSTYITGLPWELNDLVCAKDLEK